MENNQNPDQLGMEEVAASTEQAMTLSKASELIVLTGQIVKNLEQKKVNPTEFRFITSLLKGAADLAYPRPQK